MFENLAASFLVALALSAPGPVDEPTPGAEDKPFFMRSFEHALPSVLEYREAGLYGARKTPYAVSLRFRSGQWDLQLERDGRLLLKARLDKAYNRIPINRVMVASQDGDRQFVVSIPFGTPHTECFANGDEVYSQLAVQSEGKINLQHFPKCRFDEAPVKISKSGGVLLVGPPSQSP
jgi:hypothetical protein